MNKRQLVGLVASLMSLNGVHAAGFALIEQSGSGQGLSYAGAAVNAEDASVMWFNPAAMTQVQGRQIVGAAHFILPYAKFNNEGSYIKGAGPIYGDDGNGAQTGVVPNFYWKSEKQGIHYGLGINVPFGSTVSYKQDWMGRYHGVYSQTKSLNINPSIAKQLTPKLSLGAGLSAQYIEVRLTQKIDFGLAGGNAQQKDGYVDLQAGGWGFGYNLGLVYQFEGGSSLGLSYRSKVSQSPTGKADFTPPSGVTDAAYQDTNIKSSIDLPASASLSYLYPVSGKLELLADVTWTGWSSFDELRIRFDNPAKGDSVQPEGWRDVMRYSVGLKYQWSGKWMLRTGVAYDETPIKNKYLRTPRIVDSNREWLSVGVGYQYSPNMRIDLAYSHLWGGKPEIEAEDADTQLHVLKGYFDVHVDILTAQLVWKY